MVSTLPLAGIILIGLGFIVAMLFSKNKSLKRVFVVLLVVVMIPVFFMFVGRTPYPVSYAEDNVQPKVAKAIASPHVSPVWLEDIELDFQVDTYSSARLAATALIMDAIHSGELAKAMSSVDKCENIYMYLDCPVDVELTADEMQQLAEVIKSEMSAVAINVSVISNKQVKDKRSQDPDAMFIAIDTNGHSRGAGLYVVLYNADLICNISCGTYSNIDSRRFSQANWMVNYVGFCRNLKASMVVVTGCSQQSCPDMDIARQQAIQDLAVKLNAAVGEGAGFTAVDLREMDVVQDVFLQELKGTAGSVFRARAVAVKELSYLREKARGKQKITAKQAVVKQEVRMSSLMEMIYNFAGLLMALVGCYFICDFVTKGYYKGRIVITLIVVLVVGVIAMVKLLG